MNGGIAYVPYEYICSYMPVGIIILEKLCVKVRSSYFVLIKTGKDSFQMSMMLVSVGRSTMAVNPSFAFCSARLRSSVLIYGMVVRILGVNLT